MMPRAILRLLSRLRWQERRLRLTWGATRWLAVTLTLLAIACLTDWLIDRRQDTPWSLRRAMLAVQVLASAAAALFFLLRPMLRRMSDSQVALWVEDKLPRLGHRLISAVQLNRPGARTQGMSPVLIAAVTHEAGEQAALIDPVPILDRRRLRWSAWLTIPLILASALLLTCWPDTILALLQRQLLADRDIPRSLYLQSSTREVWPSGEEVVVSFTATGESLNTDGAGEARIDPDDRPGENYPLVFQSMTSSGQATFVARVPSAPGDFAYRAWLEDGRTHGLSRVHFVPRPAIVEHHAWVLLPSHWGLRPDGTPYERYQPRGEIAGVPNSKARVAVKMQKPVKEATLQLLGSIAPSFAAEIISRRINLTLSENGQEAEVTFDLRPAEVAYRIVVRDAYDFENADPPRRTIRILPEEPPHVILLPEQFPSPGGQGSIEDAEVEGMPVPLGGPIRIAYACMAHQGLGRAQLRYRINEGKWLTHILKEVPSSEKTGPFEPRQGAFARSGPRDQVEFHAVPSPNRQITPGRTEGGGRLDFQTRGIPGLKVGDRIEFYVEVFDRNPESARNPGRSETRQKIIVTTADLLAWIDQMLRQEERIRQLEARQRGIFGQGDSEVDDGPDTGKSMQGLDYRPTPPHREDKRP